MVRVLRDAEVADLLSLPDLLGVVEMALRSQGRGEVERPERPHFPVGIGLEGNEPLGTGLTMPAYIHGAEHYATKLVGVHEGNRERGIPTVNAQIVLMEAATGLPAAYMAGTPITNARTGCIGGLAARHLASCEPVVLGILGAGTQARWQARAVAAAVEVTEVRVFSPSDSKQACTADLREDLGVDARAVDSPADAVSGATVVVTATTSSEPVFPAGELDPGVIVIAVGAYNAGMQELEPSVLERAARVFADVPEEVATIGDVLATDLDVEDLVALSEVFEGRTGRENDEEILVVESVGSAVLDAAAGEHVFERAREAGVGTKVEL